MIDTSEYDLCVSAPGRITLFGEHQDYFGLPVMSAAINLRIFVCGTRRNDNYFHITLSDLNQEITLESNKLHLYQKPREYIKSGLNVMYKEGYRYKNGYSCIIKGNIPMHSGLSSSSALVVAWIMFLLRVLNVNVSPLTLAKLAHRAEVIEFNEPGGIQDHITSSFGKIVYFEQNNDDIRVFRIGNIPGYFYVVDSHQPKPTLEILARIKQSVFMAKQKLEKLIGPTDFKTLSLDEVNKYCDRVPYCKELIGILKIRDITQEAISLFRRASFDSLVFARLLNEQQKVLCENLNVSTEKINKIFEKGIDAGALGGKIIGSGGGGCVLIYSMTDISDKLHQELKHLNVSIYNTKFDDGARAE
ncbi:MAG: mevalonate kinase family protein [Candidatus Asgardarchaeia archaeon]